MFKKLSTKRIGDVGELFVAAELTRRGYIVTFTSPNTKSIDLIVINEDGSKMKNIQVKATGENISKWKMDKDDEQIKNTNLWYVFVKLDKQEQYKPVSYHILSSRTVVKKIKQRAKYDKAQFTKRNKKFNKNKKKRRAPTTIANRWFYDEENKFVDRWDKLNLD